MENQDSHEKKESKNTIKLHEAHLVLPSFVQFSSLSFAKSLFWSIVGSEDADMAAFVWL